MPLLIAVQDPRTGKWEQNEPLLPILDQPLTLSHTSLVGRQIYMVSCADDDSHSLIQVSQGGIDVEQVSLRVVASIGWQEVAKLEHKQTHELTAFTDRSLVPRHLRFAHDRIDYGMRRCRLCQELVSALDISKHVLAHTPDELAQWPGGIRGFVSFFASSLKKSRQRVQRYPRLYRYMAGEPAKILAELQRLLAARANLN